MTNPADIVSVRSLSALRNLWPGHNTTLVSAWLQGTTSFNYSAGMYTWNSTSALPDNGGGVINPTGNSGNGRWLLNSAGGLSTITPQQFGAFADNTAHLITSQDIANNTQWIGTYTTAYSWDTVAVQEAIYAAFATNSTPGNVVWNSVAGTSYLNRNLEIPQGRYFINKQLLLVATFGEMSFASRGSAIWYWQGDTAVTMFMCDSIAYFSVYNITLESQQTADFGTAAPLWVMDHTGTYTGLKTQQISIYDAVITVQGNGRGVSVNPVAGNSGQGDTVTWYNPLFSGIGSDYAIQLNGDNTLGHTFVRGDIQGFQGASIQSNGATFYLYGTTFENQGVFLGFTPVLNQITRATADVVTSSVSNQPTSLRDVRSESDILATDQTSNTIIDNCQTLAASFLNYFPSYPYVLATPVNPSVHNSKNRQFIPIDSLGTPGWKAFTGGPSVFTDSTASYTVNQWAGYAFFYRFNSGFTQHAKIVSNTATTITVDTPLSIANPGNVYTIGGYTGFDSATTSNVIITIASPAVVSWTAHGLPIGQPIIFSTTGALPTGITAGTIYYVASAGYSANSFRVSTISGGAALNTSGSQSGTQTATCTTPNWDVDCPTGHNSLWEDPVGFTTTAGSSSIAVGATIYANISVNDYLGIPNADLVGLGASNGSPTYPAMLTARVIGKSGGNTITISKNAGANVTNGIGYYGGILADNNISWLDLPFAALQGIQLIQKTGNSLGTLFNCGTLIDYSPPDRTDYLHFFEYGSSANPSSVTSINGPENNMTSYATIPSVTSPVDMTVITEQGNYTIFSPDIDCTLNFPPPITSTGHLVNTPIQEFTILFKTVGTSSYTITFGTNVTSTGTYATGTANAKNGYITFVANGTVWLEKSRQLPI